jgi:hypothetical protein
LVGLLVLRVAGAAPPWLVLDNVPRLLLVAKAAVVFVVWFHTDYPARAGRLARRAARARPTSEERGREAGRLVGDSMNAIKRWRDEL